MPHDLRPRCHATKRSYSGRHYYRPPKLGEGNVFHRYVSVQRGFVGISGPRSLLGVSLVQGPFHGGVMSRGYVWGWVCPRGWVPRIWTIGGGYQNHLILIPSGGYHTYGRQTGGKHSTGMHSCLRNGIFGPSKAATGRAGWCSADYMTDSIFMANNRTRYRTTEP